MTALVSARMFSGVSSAWRTLRPVSTVLRLRDEQQDDVAAREALLDASFGLSRFEKTCERLREGRIAADGLSFVATSGGAVIGTLRFWHVEAGCCESLMLGPLAVSAEHRSLGIGKALVEHGVSRARKLGHRAIILVGDAPYYAQFGFSRDTTLGLTLPGPVEEARFLGLELVPGALALARGRVVGTGLLLDGRRRDGLRLAA
ncbi:N-acetyltransferase [Lichenihabitans sp. PAMC28606]|uniref:GNAT family N-acetyltransferase n=1 Tax=Lichenihabitans sp. PAMC28606 TaxID=2880932 RepID=UPI001D0A3E6D|nr:N-acetyltransferase [Lichenihabitans sp. PAMC28606]UDL95750.1 N-acetyltransferase [Lichenihabitans sp. PAMC28606]